MESSLLVNLGNKLTSIRESTGLNAVDFFKKHLSGTERGRGLKASGAIANYMSAIENGRKEISYEMLLRYSEIGNVSIDQLLRGEEFVPQEKNALPQTLADILEMLFTLQETSGICNIGVKESSAGIYVSLTKNDIADLDLNIQPSEGCTFEEAQYLHYYAHGKAVLYGFLLRWEKMLQYTRNFEMDDLETAQDSYSAWKEKMLRLAARYDIYGYPFSAIPKGEKLPFIDMLDAKLVRIFESDMYQLPIPVPSNARELFK